MATELKERRTRNAKIFRHPEGGNRKLAKIYSGPVHYLDKDTGQFEEIDTTLEDTGTDFLTTKNIVSVGFRKGTEPEKFMGIRAHNDPAQQFEHSVHNITIDGRKLPIKAFERVPSLSDRTELVEIIAEKYKIVTKVGKSKIRNMVDISAPVRDFVIQFKLDLKGFTCTNKMDGTRYIPDKLYRFNFISDDGTEIRMVRPVMWSTDGQKIGMGIDHTLEIIDGNLIYTKTPNAAGTEWLKSATGNLLIDSTTSIYDDTYDGDLYTASTTWANAKAQTTPTEYDQAGVTLEGGINYQNSTHISIRRTWYFFDTSSLGSGATVNSCSSFHYVSTASSGTATVAAGTQSDKTDASTWSCLGYGGSAYGTFSIASTGAFYEAVWNSTGIAAVNVTGTTQICAMETAHDWDNVTPADDYLFSVTAYDADSGDPYLYIDYTPGTQELYDTVTAVLDATGATPTGAETATPITATANATGATPTGLETAVAITAAIAGTGATPFFMTIINDATDLQNMSNDLAGLYKLGGNIDATGTATWNSGEGFIPVGVSGEYFSGELDGDGYTIDGLTIARTTTNQQALFGYFSGHVHDLVMTNIDIEGYQYVASFVGRNYAGTIERVAARSGDIQANYARGAGICAISYGGSLTENCYSGVTVTGSGSYNAGIVADNYSTSLINKCHSYGPVNGIGTGDGGICNHDSGTTTYCHYDYQTVGISTGSGEANTTAEMQTLSTFTDDGWDFTNVWQLPSSDYPRLIFESVTQELYDTVTAVLDSIGATPTGAFTLAAISAIADGTPTTPTSAWTLTAVTDNLDTTPATPTGFYTLEITDNVDTTPADPTGAFTFSAISATVNGIPATPVYKNVGLAVATLNTTAATPTSVLVVVETIAGSIDGTPTAEAKFVFPVVTDLIDLTPATPTTVYTGYSTVSATTDLTPGVTSAFTLVPVTVTAAGTAAVTYLFPVVVSCTASIDLTPSTSTITDFVYTAAGSAGLTPAISQVFALTETASGGIGLVSIAPAGATATIVTTAAGLTGSVVAAVPLGYFTLSISTGREWIITISASN